jgi:hypothetical protein
MRSHEIRIETRKNVGKKIKRVMPELAAQYEKYVVDKKKQLFLIE